MSRKDSQFHGDLGRAVERIRELTERACSSLTVETLNQLSFRIALFLDDELGQRFRATEQMVAELKAERRAIRRAARRLRKDVDGGA